MEAGIFFWVALSVLAWVVASSKGRFGFDPSLGMEHPERLQYAVVPGVLLVIAAFGSDQTLLPGEFEWESVPLNSTIAYLDAPR